jgi:hypothetical protein
MPESVLFIDSAHATDLSSDGSTFTYRMSPPLKIPGEANPKLKVIACDLVYSSPNVSAAKQNNSLKFATWSGGTVAAGTHTSFDYVDHEITFEEGLYSLADIRSRIVDFCEAQTKLADTALDIRGESATQKCIIDWDAENAARGVHIKWTDTNSIGKLLGFTSDDITDLFDIASASRDQHYTFKGDQTANFDSVTHFQLRLSILSGDNYDPEGNSGGQLAAAIVPDVSPGSTIRYRPYHPLPCDAHVLRGGRTGSFTVRVTDNHGQPAILRESFSARIVISW